MKYKAQKKYRIKLKIECLSAYSNSIVACCYICGEINIDNLCLDHVNNNGKEHRISLLKRDVGGWNFYQKLKLMGYPEKDNIKVICGKCNNEKVKVYGKDRVKERINREYGNPKEF